MSDMLPRYTWTSAGWAATAHPPYGDYVRASDYDRLAEAAREAIRYLESRGDGDATFTAQQLRDALAPLPSWPPFSGK